MRIQVYGASCAPCHEMLLNVQTAVAELGLETPVEHTTRITDMLEAGITGTPALVVDGEVKCVGHALEVAAIKSILLGCEKRGEA